MTRQPRIGTGRLVESNAELATSKQDFNSHAEGGGFRHTADHINMNPSLGYTLNDPTVQGTFEKLQSYLVGLNFITIGDGDTSVGDFTVGTVETPTLKDCFDAAFASEQLVRGGFVMMKPGVFTVDETITIPAGVSLLGTMGGTIVTSGSSLVIGGKPMFMTSAIDQMTIGKMVGFPFTEWASDGYSPTIFSNITFVDNYIFLRSGDVPPTNPPCYLGETTSSFIQMNNNSKVIVRDCAVIGKAILGTTSANTSVTTCFVRLYDTSPGNGAVLDIQNCVIHGVQKAVSFSSTSSAYNTLKFNNNRVWGMFKSNAGTTDYMVEFSACNAELCNNIFKFQSMNTSTSPESSRGVCFHSTGAPTYVVDIVVTGNTLSYYSLSPSALKNQIIAFDYVINQRAKISNNSTGGVSDSTWYITVGDGVDTVGDINGTNALNIISNLFSYTISGYQAPSYYNLADQMTIYIRPGIYEIDSTFNSKGIGAKLIGVKENETMPRIYITNPPNPFSVTGWTMDTSSYIILGTHLENLFFYSANSNYVRIASPFYFVGLTSSQIYANSFLAKNCRFYNVGVMPREATSHDYTKIKPVDITFDSCRFSSTTSGSYTSWSAVLITGVNADYHFKNCVTEQGYFAGYPIGVFRLDSAGRPNIVIEDCDFTVTEVDDTSSSFLNLNDFGDVRIKNSVFDVSSTTSHFALLCTIYSLGQHGKSIEIDNSKFIGNNATPTSAPTTGTVGIFVGQAPLTTQITNNEFRGVTTAVAMYNYSTSSPDAHSIIFTGNKHKFSSKSSSLFWFNNNETNNCILNMIVSDNVADGSSSNRGAMLAYPSNLTNAVINCSCASTSRAQSNISIERNKLLGIITADVISTVQSAISIKGFHTSRVVGNFITMRSKSSAGQDGYVIDCQMANNATFTTDTNSSFFARDNHIEYNPLFDPSGSYILAPIYVRNIHYVNIKDNMVLLPASNTYLTNYIRVLSNPAYSPLMDGVIENNVFNNTLKYTSTWSSGSRTSLTEAKEILAHDEAQTKDSRIRVLNNKNQKAKYDVSCTKFKQYGFNTVSNIQPASLLLKTASLIQSNSYSTNLNRYAPRIISQYNTVPFGQYIGGQGDVVTWDNLPDGLYYTNMWRDGYNADPMVETSTFFLSWSKAFHTEHRILIPLSDVPRDCEILNVDIPVYLQNLSPSLSVSVETSASWIFGNSVEDSVADPSNYMRYITDPSPASKPWAKYTSTLTDNTVAATSCAKVLLSNSPYSLSVNSNTNGSWLADAENKLISNPDLYILLSINRIADGTHATENKYLAFAIPYARVTIRY